MTVQTIRYAVGNIAFLMKAPYGETLGIPDEYFGKPCVIVAPGRIRMLSDGSEWLHSSMQHRMLAFPRIGDEVMLHGCVRAVVWIDFSDLNCGALPKPLFLSGEGYKRPYFELISLPSGEHDPDLALLPAAEDGDSTPEGPQYARWFVADDVSPRTSVREQPTLTLEFDSADDLALAQGILGNLYVHGALDEANFPALTRVIERLRTATGYSATARAAYVGIGCAPVHVIAGYQEHAGKLFKQT